MEKMNKTEVSSSQAAPQETRLSQSGKASRIQSISSVELLCGRRELIIEHSGEEYRLRITSKGKLILTK